MEKKKQQLLSNEENIKNLSKRSKLRIAIMIFGILTIVFAFLNLFINFPIVVAFIFFIITTVLTKVRERTIINKNKELLKIEKALEKQAQSRKNPIKKKNVKEGDSNV